MTAQSNSEWLREALQRVRDAGALDDNHGGENWSHSDGVIDGELAAILARIEAEKREARADELASLPLSSRELGCVSCSATSIIDERLGKLRQHNKEAV